MNTLLYLIISFFLLTSFSNMEYNQTTVSALRPFEIDLIAPASGTSEEELGLLKKLKLKLNISAKCLDLSSNKVLFCAHNNEVRFKCLKEALYRKNNAIIWALRGGYGSAKIIEKLFDLQKPTHKKTVIGYSDLTALHLFLSQEWGWQSIHGAMLTELLKPAKNPENFSKIVDFLNGKVEEMRINNLQPFNKSAKGAGSIHGLITGGNLTIVETSIGTKWQIQTKDKVIFLEDVGIKPYQLDRSLLHLSQAGIFDSAKALLLGSFSEDDELTVKTLQIFAKDLKIPVFKSPKFGHGNTNYPILYNGNANIMPDNGLEYKLIMRP